MNGRGPDRPGPVLFVFSGTLETSLAAPYYRLCGTILEGHGYLCVSLDLPCHGRERKAGEPESLNGWRSRADRGEAFIAEWTPRATAVLDDLVARGYADPKRVAACGVSRGGFAAIHFAACDPRVRCVAAFAPVTDLALLSEFQGAGDVPCVRAMALAGRAADLAGRPIWVVIGDRDQRVGTDAAIAFARRVTAVSLDRGVSPAVELHVVPEPRGHTTPEGSFERAAAWIERQLQPKERRP